MTSNFNLTATIRTKLGSPNSRRAREAGSLPAIIHVANGKNLNILVNAKEFERQYFKGNILTTIVELDLDGKKINAVSHKIEMDPVTDRPIHVDFIPFAKDEQIKVQTKVKFTNQDKSPGIKRGGFLHIVFRKVGVVCSPDAIPESIEIDLGSFRMGSKVKSDDLQLPEGVKLVKRSSFIIASILGRGSKDEDGEAETAAAPAAAPAAAKK
jgi:large subunit ribosomal protein L25